METPTPNEINDRLDRATANRLAKLRDMPVDTSRIERMLRSQIPQPRPRRIAWLRPMSAVAASFAALAILAALLLSSSAGPVLASPAQMAKMHEDLVAGRTPVMQVSSIDAANKALSAQWPQSPQLPDVPQDHVMACCMKSVRNKNVACVLLKSEGAPITMTVASASDMRLPTSPTVTKGGVTYHVQSFNALNMVMTERHGRWVCLIGEMPSERLMEVAAQLQF